MINIRTLQEIAKIRKSSSLVARALQKVREAIRPGVTTAELDRIAEETIRRGGGCPPSRLSLIHISEPTRPY